MPIAPTQLDGSDDRGTGPPAPGPDSTYHRLVEAARELFGRDGYAATSLDAVAAACSVTKGSLYHHFATKTDLFAAVFEAEQRRLAEPLIAAVAGRDDLWEAAFEGLAVFLDECQHPGAQRITLLDAPGVLGWQGMREIESAYGLAAIHATIEGLMASGQMGPHDSRALAHLIFGAMCEGAMYIAQTEGDQRAARRAVHAELRELIGAYRV